MHVDRAALVERVRSALRRSPVVALLGPRQVGKTTLAREVTKVWPGETTTFDLELPSALARLSEPELALGSLKGLVVLDEIQRRPELFPVLRALADRPRKPARFLVLGSASADLLQQQSESLAGRVHFIEVAGLTLDEVGTSALDRRWSRGGFPRSFAAGSDSDSFTWRQDFVQTFLERDVAQLGIRVPSTTLRRFWSMIAHVHGQVLNWSELGRSMGVSDMTVRRYLDALQGALVVQQLPAWHENLSKRQVKAPKIYVRDSGLLHALLDVGNRDQLLNHPSSGASWEGFMLEQTLQVLGASWREAYFWATHQGAELDLYLPTAGRRLGVEFKRTAAPTVTPSMRSAMQSLKLDALVVIHAGDQSYPLAPGIEAVAARRMSEGLKPWSSKTRP